MKDTGKIENGRYTIYESLLFPMLPKMDDFWANHIH